MNLIFRLPVILEESKKEYEQLKHAVTTSFFPIEKRGDSTKNLLVQGDNLEFMRFLLTEEHLEGKLQLIYMDPPFYSQAKYDAVINLETSSLDDPITIKPIAYEDQWKNGMEDYLRMLCVRFYLIHDLLSEEGCFWLHLDWHVVHYVKILLDEIFGEKNFVNEIIWNYKSGGTGKRSFSRKHDTLLFYGKSKHYYFNPLKEKSYNRGYKPYRFKGVKEYQDEMGWYTMVNMKDVWQIDMVGRTSAERTGYATQKPQQLLERIIESCSREGDLCADFFSGSGTLASTAEKMNRQWIACDIGGIATVNCLKRISGLKGNFTLMAQRMDESGDRLIVAVEQEDEGIKVLLKSYNLEEGKIPLCGEELEELRAFCIKDSLQLLDYWSVDFQYDGKLHKPQFVFPKEKGQISVSCSINKIDVKCISIRAVDVFGNRMQKVIDYR